MKHLIGLAELDFWFTSLRASQAFIRGGKQGTGGAVFNEVQLLNPAASGVSIIVYRLKVGAPTSGSIQTRVHNPALATLVGTGINLLQGGAAGVGEVRTASPAAADGNLVSEIHRPNSADYDASPPWHWELPAGTGVLFTTSGQAEEISAEFYWVELQT